MSLNFAAFAKWMHSPEKRSERVLGKLIALGNPFFQIESLYRFNAKFFPRWEPRYLVYEGALGLPRAGIAAMWAEGQLPKPPVYRRPATSADARVASALTLRINGRRSRRPSAACAMAAVGGATLARCCAR